MQMMINSGVVQFDILNSNEFNSKTKKLSTSEYDIAKAIRITFTMNIPCVNNFFVVKKFLKFIFLKFYVLHNGFFAIFLIPE